MTIDRTDLEVLQAIMSRQVAEHPADIIVQTLYDLISLMLNEELSSKVGSVSPKKKPKGKTFKFTIQGEVDLDIDDIWPDTGPPQARPTVQDVIKYLQDEYGTNNLVGLIAEGDWNLPCTLSVDGKLALENK